MFFRKLPFQYTKMDILVPLPKGEEIDLYALVLLNSYTNPTMAILTSNTYAATVLCIILENWVENFDIPSTLQAYSVL